MMTFLNKLEDAAKGWLETVDEKVQQPLVQVMSGEVFTQGTPLEVREERPTQPVAPSNKPNKADTQVMRLPILRNANAFDNR